MTVKRRTFLKTSAALPFLAASHGCTGKRNGPDEEKLKAAMEQPVLDRSPFPDPVILESVDLYENRGEFFVRAVSKDGAEGFAVSNPAVMRTVYPILLERVSPFFRGKDARDLEALLEGVYLHDSNYKWQGLPFWVCTASVELAVLDLLGRISRKPAGALLGGIVRAKTGVYRASSHRGNTAAEEAEYLKGLVDRYGFRAVKFRLGGRMRYDGTTMKRDTELLPLARKVLGDIAIYADANGSFDVPAAVRIGRLMEEIGAVFFEEPCPFDFYGETARVSEQLTIPVAGGEEESSTARFRWMIANRVLDIVQPDLFYFGGLIRSIRVARMAASAGMDCIPHMSGGGLGFLYVLHFASCVPNTGPHQEYKGEPEGIPFECPTSTLKSENGEILVPSGPGFGIELDPDYIRTSRKLESSRKT